MDIVRFDYDNTVDHVMKNHKRKVSQLHALEEELGLYFDEDEAERIAKQTMKELNPNNSAVQQVSVEQIVNKARKEHKRKVSQFKAIQTDIGQYFPNEEESAKLAAEIMKEFNPNDRSGRNQEVTVDSIVEKAMNEHSRRKSQFQAIESELGLIFDKEDVNAITKDVMKKVFAQKHAGSEQQQMEQLEQSHAEEMQRKVDELQQELQAKNEELEEKNMEIERMRQEIKHLTESKRQLAVNSNQCLNQMRGYLLQYQQSIFKK
mmetsp:Transcript_34619/g.55588  ORF Transcript_34619/g.55588 Transcript_34619/m.55588 type:complete len:262 (-) Transcript_34619:269-1054(-)